MKKYIADWWIHTLLFIVFLSLPYVFSQEEFSIFKELKRNPHEKSKLLSYFIFYIFFYVNYFVFIPRFFVKKKYWIYITIIIGSFVSVTAISRSINWLDRPPVHHEDFGQMPPPPPHLSQEGDGFPRRHFGHKPPVFGMDLSHSIALFIAGLFLTFTLYFNKQWKNTENEKLAAEITFLKAQINPHFLFNTLNTVYSLCLEENAPQSAESIAKISNLLRYVVYTNSQDFVTLEQEINYINDFIALQKMRFGETLQLNYDVKGDKNGKQIAPLILINFIENAFKYGISPEKNSNIDIQLDIQSEALFFTCKNKILNPNNENNLQMGLENTIKRIKLLYPEKHHLEINEENDHFNIFLELGLV